MWTTMYQVPTPKTENYVILQVDSYKDVDMDTLGSSELKKKELNKAQTQTLNIICNSNSI